ncbi:glycosyltransferase family protein [Actinophytocola xanthii]|uniref:Alpha-1,2-mannosyltransferase n=1 Tax=Actinophytocola xanthii TaxID=1912961 RepID=A0A1Q8CK06_9PSEU|nr:hypothetical protein [Actinophytocola xanthii]OLF14669.1 hypothetical protein BU204_25910 [Actinophytocola xanthii]
MLAASVTACTIVVATRASRRGEELLALTLCGLCAAAVSPWAWGHHWVWLLPLGAFLVTLALGSTARPRCPVWILPAALVPLTVPPVLALAVPPPNHQPALDTGPVAFVLGNVYVVVFAATLLASVVHLSRLDPPAARAGLGRRSR